VFRSTPLFGSLGEGMNKYEKAVIDSSSGASAFGCHTPCAIWLCGLTGGPHDRTCNSRRHLSIRVYTLPDTELFRSEAAKVEYSGARTGGPRSFSIAVLSPMT